MWSRQQNAPASPALVPGGRTLSSPLVQARDSNISGSQARDNSAGNLQAWNGSTGSSHTWNNTGNLQAWNGNAPQAVGTDGPGQKRGAPSPATGSGVVSRTNWESGRSSMESRSHVQQIDQQTNLPFRPGPATSQNPGMGAGLNSGAPFTASIAQRRLQRRPMGLRLDNIAGSGLPLGSLGANRNGPPPTARGTWTMGGQGTAQPLQPPPAVPSGHWDDSAPSTPGPGQIGRQEYHHNRPLGIVGTSFNPSNGGSVCGTPSDAPESLTSFQRQVGPLSYSYGGVVPLGGSYATSPKESSLGGAASLGGSSGSLSRRPSVRQQRMYPMNRVSGLNYISISELADMMSERGGVKRGLVIDMRRSAAYLASRIVSAVNMTVPTTLVKRRTFAVERLLAMLALTSDQKQLATNWKSAAWVVLYGEGAPEDTASEDTSLVLMARKFMAEASESCKVFVLQDGFKEFGSTYTSLCEFGGGQQVAAERTIPSLSLPPSTMMPMMSVPLESASTPMAQSENSDGLPMLARPTTAGLKRAVDVDHPMLRTMRQIPGGEFDPSEVVAMRLPHDFSTQQRSEPGSAHESQRLQALPTYLRRAADPETGPRLLNRLFRNIDDSESRRISSMIGSHGMRTQFNKYTIAAGLELGQKNRYKNIFPFDRNRVKLGGRRQSRESSSPVAESVSPPAFDGKELGGLTPSASVEGADVSSMGGSVRVHGGRPFSIDVSSTRPSSLQGIESMRLGKRGGTKRISHQMESKSKGQLLLDDMDGMGSESDFSGGPEQATCDYVNASYVQYFGGPMYIATQGPLPATVDDFWRMVWEERSRVIVMLTKEFETGRPKCHRYWPARPGDVGVYGSLHVEFQAEAQHPDDASVIARRFLLTRPSMGQASMCVTHLQYTGWADHGIPENPLGVLRLRQLAHQAQAEGEQMAAGEQTTQIPMVVHCSAGCGRTGAFCVIDTIMRIDEGAALDADGDVAMGDVGGPEMDMQMLPSGSSYDRHGMFTGLIPQALRSKSSGEELQNQAQGQPLNQPQDQRSLSHWNDEPPAELHEDRVFMVVSRFREQRVTMVQTIKQFVFCHEALAWSELGATPRPIDHVIDRRLVAEWNRTNHPEISETDRTDITYMMRGRQEMVHAMQSSEMGSTNSTATVSGGPMGRASIDIVSGMPDISDDEADNEMPAVKRSNTVGPGRSWLVGSLFKAVGARVGSGDSDSQSAPTSRVASRQRGVASSAAKDQAKEPKVQHAKPPRMVASLSSGPRFGTSMAVLSPQAPIAEESSSTESEYNVASPAFAAAPARLRMALPSMSPPMMTCGMREPADDYFGAMVSQVESPADLGSGSSWHMDSASNRGGSTQSPQSFVSKSALASPVGKD
ncbi:hypothetical protein IW147_002321 [Coemansia sp. RSA 720]|nr:hypothetical protein IW147_002321 [Coemansia sp. RSA 720]